MPALDNWGWWALAADGVYFLQDQGGVVSLKHFDPIRRTTRLLSRLPAQVVAATPALTVTSDGKHVVYVQIDPGSSDIMLIEKFH